VVDGVAQAITERPINLAIGGPAHPETYGPDGIPQRPIVIRRVGGTVLVEAPPGVPVVVNGQQAESSTALAAGDRLQIGEPPLEVLFVTMAP
jgi:hypothetical protein